MKHEGSTFLSGCAPFHFFIFFAKELDEMVERGTPNSSFFLFNEQDSDATYRQYDGSVGWPAIAMATIKPGGSVRHVVAIGPNGDYWEVEPQSLSKGFGKIEGFQGNLRALSVIEDRIFACGMGRVVLRREERGRWTAIGPGPGSNDPAVTGFEDIDGFARTEMYAVGWGGELWWLREGAWVQIDSPTSVNLTALCCAIDGQVYAVGHEGTLLRGRGDAWSLVDTERKENLRDVAYFDGTLYVTTDFRILRLQDDVLVNDDNFADEDDVPGTCLHLLGAADGLISLGTKDVFRIQSGGKWERLV